MYTISNNFILFIIVIAGLIYLLIQVRNLRAKITKFESYIEDYIEFEHKVTLLGVSPQGLIEYLNLRHKHKLEKITMMIMPKDEEDKIDKDALTERQKQEIEDLISKKRQSPDIAFPAKK